MKYTIDEAIIFSNKNNLDKWVQLFLRDVSYKNANPNIALADGLLLEKRFYIGPVLIDLDSIITVRTEMDLEGDELKYYEEVVERISKDYKVTSNDALYTVFKEKSADGIVNPTTGMNIMAILLLFGIVFGVLYVSGKKQQKKEIK